MLTKLKLSTLLTTSADASLAEASMFTLDSRDPHAFASGTAAHTWPQLRRVEGSPLDGTPVDRHWCLWKNITRMELRVFITTTPTFDHDADGGTLVRLNSTLSTTATDVKGLDLQRRVGDLLLAAQDERVASMSRFHHVSVLRTNTFLLVCWLGIWGVSAQSCPHVRACACVCVCACVVGVVWVLCVCHLGGPSQVWHVNDLWLDPKKDNDRSLTINWTVPPAFYERMEDVEVDDDDDEGEAGGRSGPGSVPVGGDGACEGQGSSEAGRQCAGRGTCASAQAAVPAAGSRAGAVSEAGGRVDNGSGSRRQRQVPVQGVKGAWAFVFLSHAGAQIHPLAPNYDSKLVTYRRYDMIKKLQRRQQVSFSSACPELRKTCIASSRLGGSMAPSRSRANLGEGGVAAGRRRLG